jgi:hypothetical protein
MLSGQNDHVQLPDHRVPNCIAHGLSRLDALAQDLLLLGSQPEELLQCHVEAVSLSFIWEGKCKVCPFNSLYDSFVVEPGVSWEADST